MTKRICVHLNEQPVYDIVLTASFETLAAEVGRLNTEKKKLCIVTDSNVAPLYLEEVTGILSSVCAQTDTLVIPAGEAYKNLDTVKEVYKTLIEKSYDRSDLLVALGGGVTGDLTGFAAATYLRGIDFIQIPTTLLSQVDSSIGGKTGVDFDAYKNMVGAFHMPKLVYTNVSVLKTLTEEQYVSGMGEVVKHGLIRSRDYYDWLGAHETEIWAREASACMEMIYESNLIKRDVVEIDPTEQGIRGLLNFGHTLGHAVEKLKEFSMPHGHCVAVGFLAASAISLSRGALTRDQLNHMKELMAAFHMPVSVDGLKAADVLDAASHDKKMEHGTIKFILLKQIGDACIDRTVTREEMLLGLKEIGIL